MSALPQKADMAQDGFNVRFVPKADCPTRQIGGGNFAGPEADIMRDYRMLGQ